MIESIHWFRTDLRLEDNHALTEATKNGNTICVFVLDKELIKKIKAKKRLAFLFHSIQELKLNLQELGSDLILLEGNYIDRLSYILEKTGAKNLYFNKDYTPYSLKRDQSIEKHLLEKNIKVNKFKDYSIFDEDEIIKENKEPFKVFTAYKTEWLKVLKNDLSHVSKFDINKSKLTKFNIDNDVDFDKIIQEYNNDLTQYFTPGEKAAIEKWNIFYKDKINKYKLKRDFLYSPTDLSNTSTMSPYLKFGLISPRRIVRDCISVLGTEFDSFRVTKNPQVESYLSEIIWREFYKSIIYKYPNTVSENFQSKFNNIHWINNMDLFNAWCNGNTGYPIVDASMRQMNTIGWMHNRSRMIVASFLCKDLHIDWKLGERYFYDNLIDYDLGSNVGGWQWTAGTGTDASPYFRIFNPIEQTKKFDPEAKFIKKYIPELGSVSTKDILLMNILQSSGYPKPIIDHSKERKTTLELYKI